VVSSAALRVRSASHALVCERWGQRNQMACSLHGKQPEVMSRSRLPIQHDTDCRPHQSPLPSPHLRHPRSLGGRPRHWIAPAVPSLKDGVKSPCQERSLWLPSLGRRQRQVQAHL
jgi:hypothetical protein